MTESAVASWPEPSSKQHGVGQTGAPRSYAAPCAAVAITTIISTMLYIGLPPVDPRAVRGGSGPASVAEVEGQPRLSFVALGDWGRNGNEPQRATAAQMAIWAATVRSPFVLSVGDNFYTDGVNSATDSQWTSSWAGVYNQPAMASKPWYSLLGNHDYRGQYLQVGWPGDARWTLPNPFYTAIFDLGSGAEISGPRSGVSLLQLLQATNGVISKPCLAMVFVDTCPWIAEYRSASTAQKEPQFYSNIMNATATATQLSWLDATLELVAPVCPALVVVGHHPLYTPGEHGDNPPLIDNWAPLFDKYGVDAYLAGHDHTLAHLEAGGVQYVVTGAGSTTRNNSAATPQTVFLLDATPGFTVHSANRTHLAHTYMSAAGVKVFQRTVPLRRKPALPTA